MSPEELIILKKNGQLDMLDMLDKPEVVNDMKLLSEDDFINEIAYENRFVSIEMSTGKFKITEIDSGLTLNDMKKQNPDFITQLQKVNDENVPDKTDNVVFIEKLRDLRGKRQILESLSKVKKNSGIDDEASEIIKEEKYGVQSESPEIEEERDSKKTKTFKP